MRHLEDKSRCTLLKVYAKLELFVCSKENSEQNIFEEEGRESTSFPLLASCRQ